MKIKLTYELIHALGKSGKGFNATQLRLLGIKWPPKHGWQRELIGKEVDDGLYATCMALKGVSKGERRVVLRGKHEPLDMSLVGRNIQYPNHGIPLYDGTDPPWLPIVEEPLPELTANAYYRIRLGHL